MLIIRELFPNIIWKVWDLWVNSSIIYCFILKWNCEGAEAHPSCTQTGGRWLRTGQVISSTIMIHSNKWIISELTLLAKSRHHTTFGQFLYFIQYLWLASWLCGPSFSALLPPPGWCLLPDGPTTVQLDIQKRLYWLSTVSKYVIHALVLQKCLTFLVIVYINSRCIQSLLRIHSKLQHIQQHLNSIATLINNLCHNELIRLKRNISLPLIRIPGRVPVVALNLP